MNENEKCKLSVVVSVYNEEAALTKFYNNVSKILIALGCTYEIVFVNDGSTDDSRINLFHIANMDNNVKVLHFSRNFGHEAAMIAGIDYAKGDTIVCMDADLQHPPEYLPQILEKIDEGYDVINMVRTRNKSAGFLKNITSKAFYNIINRISDTKLENGASDFFGISRRVADILRGNYREKIRFLRGYVQNVGFKKTTIEYEAADRIAGKSKYSMKKLMRFSVNTIMCFSNMPLKLGLYAGSVAAFMGVIVAIYTIVTWAKIGTPSGYATIIVLICFMFAIMFMIIGIIGEYISILFAELKDRPIYIVEETINIEE